MQFRPDSQFPIELDQQDLLAHFRKRFIISDPDLIYMDGNSLGRLLKTSINLTQDLVQNQWGNRLIRGWNDDWMALPEHIGGKIGRLLGANADEIIVADSTSVNLFKLALSAVLHQPQRHKIITDDLNFPSDLYVLEGVAKLAGRPLTIQRIPSPDGIHGPVEALAQAIDDDTALVTLTHTVFKSAYTYDMAAISQLAHEAGALTLWDLSHAAGSVEVDLQAAQADLAVGCTYKYLNGGPGAPAFLYVRRDLQNKLANSIPGWMGQRRAFDFGLDYDPESGMRHFLTGTPPVLSMAIIEPGIDILLEAGMVNLRAKSLQQTEYLIYLWQQWLEPLGFSLNTPRDGRVRGSHISLGHKDGWRIDQALINDMKVIPDFRHPDNIRLGVTPLYTSYQDIYKAAHRLRAVVTEAVFEKYDRVRAAVT
ncbi:MAG: kynureninase [Chloroflexi bacterium]|nr:kynureninase [Chloroflexota bacterium]